MSVIMDHQGPHLWITANITKKDFMIICDIMDCSPELDTEGGFIHMEGENHNSGYKSFHLLFGGYYFQLIKPNSNSPPKINVWPHISDSTGNEWRGDHDILFEKGQIIRTRLKVHNANPFSRKELDEWRFVLEGFSIYFSISLEVLEYKIITFKTKDLEKYAYLLHLKDTDKYKIGSAKNVRARVSTLQTANPENLILIAYSIGGFVLENYLHKKFQPKRIRGEWFTFTPEEVKEIKEIFTCVSESKEIPFTPSGLNDSIVQSVETRIEKLKAEFTPIREENTLLESTRKFPECPGRTCWCYDCSWYFTWPENFRKEAYYSPEKHFRRAIKWAKDVRELWGWKILGNVPENPPCDKEPQNKDLLYRYLDRLFWSPEVGKGIHATRESIKRTLFIKNKRKNKHKKNVKVIAKWVSQMELGFECPFCWTEYRINGEPYKGAKRVIHTHSIYNMMKYCEEVGCEMKDCPMRHYQHTELNDFENNFSIIRTPHCKYNILSPEYFGENKLIPFPDEYNVFSIYVTNETQRIIKLHKGEPKV